MLSPIDLGGPVRLVLTRGQVGDTPAAAALLPGLRAGATLIADCASSPSLYRQRNRVERFLNRIEHFRGRATWYDKTDANHFAGHARAAIRIWLKSYQVADETVCVFISR